MSIIQSIGNSANGVLGSIKSGRGFLDNIANKILVQPVGLEGIGGFVFDYEGETRVTKQADITDHFVEDNSYINDHRALRPVKIICRGFFAELVYRRPKGLSGALAMVQSRLAVVPAYLGDYTPGMVQKIQNATLAVQNTLDAVDTTLSRAQNIVDLVRNASPADSNQKKAFSYFESAMDSNPIQLFTVQTPYRQFFNMAVEMIDAVQDENTKIISEFSITLKEIRFAKVEFGAFDKSMFAGYAVDQHNPETANGKGQGTDVGAVDESMAYQWATEGKSLGQRLIGQ